MKSASIWRSLLGGIAGLGLVIGLFFLTHISLKSFGGFIAQLNWFAFAGIVVCSFLYVVLGAVKWHLISGVPSPRAFFYTHFTAQAMLIGQFLPVPVAVAVNRAAVMKLKQNVAVKKGVLNAFYDMGFDFLVAALLMPVSFLQWLYGFSFCIWLAAGILIITAAGFLLMRAPKILPGKWLAKPVLAGEHARGLLTPRLIGPMMLLSAARFALVIVRLMLGVVAIGIAVPFAIVAYATPPATMSSLLMLTPANLGIAEWSWAYLLALWHVPVAVGALYGVSFRILVFMAQLVVSIACYLLYSTAPKKRFA
jgi:hypothetical protein